MRKFWTILTVALVAFGAVACDDKITDDDSIPAVDVDKVTFSASVEDVTRTYLLQDGEIYHTKWIGDEQLCVETADAKRFYFNNTKSKPNTFSCDAEGVGAVLNKEVTITHVKDVTKAELTVDSSAGVSGIKLVAKATMTEGAQISMHAECAFLLYSSASEVTFTTKGGSSSLFYEGGVAVSTITLPGGNNIFVPIAAYSAAEGNAAFELSYAISGQQGKSTNLTPVWNKIYDLGVLTPTTDTPVTPTSKSVYLVPNDGWKSDGAWFAAYFYADDTTYQWVKAEDADADGVYECAIPDGMIGVTFVRMNAAALEMNWENKWNEAAAGNLPIDSYNHFYITDWESGEWHEAGYTVPTTPDTPVTPDMTDAVVYLVPGVWNVDSAWFAAYFFDANGANYVVKMADVNGIYECNVPAGMTSVIFCRMNPAYAEFGWNSETEADHVWNQTGDETVGVAPANYYYITGWETPGEWHEAGYQLPENPDTPDTPVTPDMTDAVVYLASGVWNVDGAWFAAYFFDANGANYVVKMADVNGVYECNVPAGMTSVIFCRMNPAYAEFGWNSETEADHVWNQTGDETVGVAPANYYYITGWETPGEWHEAGYQLPENPGTPDTPVTPDMTDAVVYLASGVWNVDGAWFAAHFYNDADGFADVKMEATQTEGVYQCNVPTGMTKVLFCRVNPATTTFDWSMVWNQTEGTDIGVAPANYYYITGWETPGEWHEAGYTIPTTPETPVTGQYALAGSFNEWGDLAMENLNGIFAAKGVAMAAYAEFKVKAVGSWDENYGGGISYLDPNNHMEVVKGGSNVAITAEGTYDVYFDLAALKLYVVTAGADYTTAPLQSQNGKEPEVEQPEVTENVVYLKPNSNWKEANARFAAYFWNDGGSNTWVSATDVDGDGIYEINLPTGYTTNIIFCRMNPSTTANNWNNKWNQTADLVIPTDGKNLFTVTEGAWDGDKGTWSVK